MRKGFTLVEAVVVLGIVALGMIVLGMIVVWQSSFYAVETVRIDVLEEHNTALEALARDIRTGSSVVESYDTHTTGTTTLVLALPVLGSETTEGIFDYIAYFPSSTELMRQAYPHASSQRAAGSRVLTHFMDSVSFTFDVAPPDTRAVTAQLVSKHSVRDTTHTASDEIVIGLRNK